jgi:hypothetical protein
VPPEERDDERRPAVTACAQRRVGSRVERDAGERTIVRVPSLVEDRPAVVVAAVDVRPTFEQQSHEGLVASCEAEQVVAVRAAHLDELRIAVEKLAQSVGVTRLDCTVGQYEGGQRLAPVA